MRNQQRQSRYQRDAEQLGAYQRAREVRAVTLQAAQNALAKEMRAYEWNDVEDLRDKTIPLFSELAAHIGEMGAAAACDLWDAFIPTIPSYVVFAPEPDRYAEIVRAAMRFAAEEPPNIESTIGELQRQLQIIYDQAKARCMDGQEG